LPEVIVDTRELLGKSFNCECGHRHAIPTEYLIYAPDAIEQLPELTGRYMHDPDYCIVADTRTYEAAGRKIEKVLKDNNAIARCFIVPDHNGRSPVTNTETRDLILKEAPDAGIYIASGSGTINDLTKWVAYERGKPFVTVPTAASMNGYASANVSASIGGLKVLFHAEACKGVFADPAILADAPFEMTTSGLGDVVAKPVSSADWKLNQILFDEHYCQFSVDLLKNLEPVYFENPRGIRERNPDSLRALFEALFYSSVAMTITGTSAPASGGEHLISHTIDMIADLEGKTHDLHGRQVGVGTILSAALYERVLSIEKPEIRQVPPDIDENFWGPLSDVVREEYRKKLPKFRIAAEKLSETENWENLCSALRQNLLSPQRIKNCLREAGAAHRISDIRIDSRAIEADSFMSILQNANQMRERFTILDLAILLGVMPEQSEDIASEWIMN
jgi:glycerol-1-phosphate dehydrogenase [NAD(P)+]